MNDTVRKRNAEDVCSTEEWYSANGLIDNGRMNKKKKIGLNKGEIKDGMMPKGVEERSFKRRGKVDLKVEAKWTKECR